MVYGKPVELTQYAKDILARKKANTTTTAVNSTASASTDFEPLFTSLRNIYPSKFKTGAPEEPYSVAKEIYEFANNNPEAFHQDLMTLGKTNDTVNLLKSFGANDEQINQIYPQDNAPPVSIDDFAKDYFQKQGYTDLPKYLGGTFNRAYAVNSSEIIQSDIHLKEATEAYKKLYGDEAYLRATGARVAKAAGTLAPAGAVVNPFLGLAMAAVGSSVSTKTITPEQEKITLTDWLNSGAMVALFGSPLARGVGGVAGRTAQTGLLGGATLSQSAATALDWSKMDTLEKVGSVAFIALMGTGTAFSAKGALDYAAFRKATPNLPVSEKFYEDMYQPTKEVWKAQKELESLKGNLAKETPAKVEALNQTLNENAERMKRIIMDLKAGKYGSPTETSLASQTQIPEELGVILRANGVEVPETPQGAWAALFNLGKQFATGETGAIVPGAPIGRSMTSEEAQLLRETMTESMKSDPLVNKQIVIGVEAKTGKNRYMALGDYLYWRYGKHGEIPESFSKSEANIIAGYPPEHVWPDNMINKVGKVKREYIMDRVAEETGVDDLDTVIENLNANFEQRLALKEMPSGTPEPQMAQSTSVQTGLSGFGKEQAQVKMFEESNTAVGQGGVKQNLINPETPIKPLEGQVAIPEVGTQIPETGNIPPAEPPKPPTAEGAEPSPEPEPEPERIKPTVEEVMKKLIPAIKDAKPARAITEELKHAELSRRAAIAAAILQGGEGAKAFEKSKSALYGVLPQEADYTIDLEKYGITDEDITVLFDKIRLSDLQFFQKLNTSEALSDLLIGKIPTEGQLVLLEKMFGAEFVKTIMAKRTAWQKAKIITQEVLNIPRTLQTIGDFSATLRQGILLSVGQPKQFGKAFTNQFKAVFSPKNYKAIDGVLRNMKYADKAEEHKLYMAPVGEAASISSREEGYMGRILEKIPVLGAIVRGSERAYNTMLNTLRMETWAYWCRKWEGTGKSWKDYDDLAFAINHLTGRGDLGKLENAGAWLNATFFSPRYIASRIQVPIDLATSTPAVRKMIARNLVSFWLTGLGVIGLAVLAGAKTETDPRSADFGKVKIGNTRIEFWAGYLPYIRMVTQLWFAERKVTATGAVIPVDRQDIANTFLRSKLAPIPGLIWDLAEGQTFVGEELTPENAQNIVYEKMTMMFIQDIVDAIKDSGMAGAAVGPLSALGVGVQTYEDNWNTEEAKLGLPVLSEDLPYTTEDDLYTVNDYYSKVGKMIGTATYDMLKNKQGVPEKVLSVAQARDIKKQISDIPNTKLISINAEPKDKLGKPTDTYEQYYVQWKERSKLVSQGDNAVYVDGNGKTHKGEDAVIAFDGDYDNAHLGNMTQNQYVLLKQYHAQETQSKKNKFVIQHPELNVNPRQEWLKKHPEENALLSLWGQTDALTLESYKEARKSIAELDIPENAVGDELPPDEIASAYYAYIALLAEGDNSKANSMLIKNPELYRYVKGKELPTKTSAGTSSNAVSDFLKNFNK